jgi:hypothetical protein
MHEEIMSRIYSVQARYPSVQNVLSSLIHSDVQSCNLILSLRLCGYGTCSVTQRGEHGLRVYENGVLRFSSPNRQKITMPITIGVTESVTIRLDGHVARTEEVENYTQVR